MNLGEFHTVVQTEANKGTTLSGVIPSRVRMAARWLERNYTLKYMEQYKKASLADGCVRLPNTVIKTINFIRYYKDSKWHYIKQIDPRQERTRETAFPTGFWIDGVEAIRFDAWPDEQLEVFIGVAEYTIWPTELTATHWLLDNAEDALLAKTMMLLAPHARESRWLELYRDMMEGGIRTLLLADEELRQGARDEAMEYGEGVI